jgi:hypothetical protein
MNRTELIRKGRATADDLLRKKGYVAVVDVLLAMGRLSKEDYEKWRLRQVPYLERVLPGSLNQHAFLCRELRAYARDVLALKASRTVYMSWGKAHKQPLRFSKFGNPHLEELFSTHYVSPTLAAKKKDYTRPAGCDGSTFATSTQRHEALQRPGIAGGIQQTHDG